MYQLRGNWTAAKRAMSSKAWVWHRDLQVGRMPNMQGRAPFADYHNYKRISWAIHHFSFQGIMSDSTLYSHLTNSDRFEKSVMMDVRKEMTLRIERLQRQQEALTKSLNKRFDVDEYRRLNIVNQHILVASSRRKGDWVRGDFPQYATLGK